MTELRKQLKTDARRFLRFNWAGAIMATLVFAAGAAFCVFVVVTLNYAFGLTTPATLFSVPSVPSFVWGSGNILKTPLPYITAGEVLLYLLVIPPLWVGRCKWYLERSFGRKAPSGKSRLRSYAHVLYVSLYVTLLKLLCGTPILILSWMCLLQLRAAREQAGWPEWLYTALLILLLLAAAILFLCWLALIQRWMLLPYLAFLYPEMSLRRMVAVSRKATRGLRIDLTFANLSFVGWGISCLLVFPVLYVLPYYEQTMALYARYLLERAMQCDSSLGTSEGLLNVPAQKPGDTDPAQPAPPFSREQPGSWDAPLSTFPPIQAYPPQTSPSPRGMPPYAPGAFDSPVASAARSVNVLTPAGVPSAPSGDVPTVQEPSGAVLLTPPEQ